MGAKILTVALALIVAIILAPKLANVGISGGQGAQL